MPTDDRTSIQRYLDRRQADLMSRRFWLTEAAEAIVRPARLVPASTHHRRVFARLYPQHARG